MATLWECERFAREKLASTGKNESEDGLLEEQWDQETILREAAYLVEGVWAIDATARYLMRDKEVTLAEKERFEEALSRRKKGEPLALILQKKWFYGAQFAVDSSTLIPRADSETLIDVALSCKNFIQDSKGFFKILDWGTGSGCLLITLLRHFKAATGVGIDKSEQALQIAKQNGVSCGVDDRVLWVRGDWSLGISKDILDKDLPVMVVSNPPYITCDALQSLAAGVKNYEPMVALDGGKDGLVAIRHVLATTAGYGSDTLLLMEIGIGQEQAVTREANLRGWRCLRYEKDGNGIVRILVFDRAI